MPFGSNPRMLKPATDAEGKPMVTERFAATKLVRVTVPSAPAPEWWSEYLQEEWKRKNGLTGERRNPRTQWQRSSDDFDRSERSATWKGWLHGKFAGDRHDIWGMC